MKGNSPVSDFDVAHLTTVHVPTDNRIAMKECAALVQAGLRVCLIACGGPSPGVEGLTFYQLPKQPGRVRRLILGNWNAWRKLRQLRPRLLHVHDPELVPLAAAYKIRYRTKAIYDAHEEFGKQIAGKPYLPGFLRKPTALVGYLLETFANWAMDEIIVATATIGQRYKATKVTVVQNYPWRNTFDATYRPTVAGNPTVAYVGAITVERGIREMIAAVSQCEPKIQLVLAGPTAFGAQQAIDDAPADRVRYLGHLPATEIPNVLANAFAGLAVLHALPNYVESQPTKVYEYMAAGRPFIASKFDRWVEQFGSNECGIFVDPTDVNQVRSAIERLAADADMANAMGSRGRSEFLTRFTFDQEAGKLVDRTKTLLGERRG